MLISNSSEPDVTVVVIVYNDSRRVERAVRSVLNQTLRSCEIVIVDDASTDDTPQVVERLVNEAPDRVRSIRLAENSGAGGRPRNIGITAARGRYVMFLDSDDVLDRHACVSLVYAAERTGADVVAGRCVRHYVERGIEQPWLPWLFTRQAVYTSLSEEPRLLYDVISTNKLYRRQFLIDERILFPEHRFYEDNLFTAHVYLVAKKIAVIPHRVYTWHVEEKAARLSVTNRARDLRNLVDRIATSRDTDELLRKFGTPELQLRKDIRFIENDLRIHLANLRSLPEEQVKALVDTAAEYVDDLDPEAFELANRLPAIAAVMVRQRDYEGVIAAHDYMVQRGRARHLTTHLVERDGRVYWGDRHLDDPLARRVFDVTSLGLHDQPLGQLELGTRLTEVEIADGQTTIRGEVVNPLGRIPASLRAELEFHDRQTGHRRYRVPVTVTHDPRRIRWQAQFDPRKAIHPIGLVDAVWVGRLRLKVGDETADLRIFADAALRERAKLPVRPKLGALAGDVLEAYETDRGDIAFRLVAQGKLARTANGALHRLRSTRLGATMWNRSRDLFQSTRDRLSRRSTKVAVYHRFLTRLPIQKRAVVFESHMGKQYSDSPRAIYEELRRRGAAIKPIWVYAASPAGFPKDVKLVKRGSWAYYWALATARFWVDNQGFPHDLRKRPGTTYIQTWHGSAFKRMGFDEAAVKQATRGEQQRLQRAVDRFDVFLVRSEHDVRTLARALRLRAELLRVGYPRNDALVRGGDPAELARLRRQLGIADGRRVLLYAPTFRPKENGRGAQPLVVPFDLDRFVERFGDELFLLVRPHYLATCALPPGLRRAVRNVAHIHDITPLMLISDALITDYSSVMFDYALLDRPMVFHVPDYDDYVNRSRGAYFDLLAHAPGPITHTDDDLFDALADLPGVTERYADHRKEFVSQFGEYDTGNAATAVVDRFFLPGGRRG